jgi:RNA polymerase primary sigma factor
VPNAAQEIELAQGIEALEIAHWRSLLSYVPALDLISLALKSQLGTPKELQGLRRLSRSAARPAHGWEAQLSAAAEQLRALDVSRVVLAEVDAKVREVFVEQPAALRYLQQVERARLAQQEAKNRFMTANLRLVVSLARRYDSGLMPLADLIQEGNLGLMRAVERFDHRRGFRFSTYAGWWIRHGLSRALSDKGRLVRLPAHLLDDAQRVARASTELSRSSGEAPRSSELADKTGLSEEKLAFVQLHATGGKPSSLDRKVGDDGETTLLDILPDPDGFDPEETLDLTRWSGSLTSLLSVLTPIEVAILRFRFGLDDGEELTLREVGDKYNLSRERVRQLQEQALDKLRAELARESEERSGQAA